MGTGNKIIQQSKGRVREVSYAVGWAEDENKEGTEKEKECRMG